MGKVQNDDFKTWVQFNPTPGHISRKDENSNSKRYMHPNVHSSTIYNRQDVEATKCPSRDEWIKKMWYIYTMEYYAAIKKNEIMPFAATWMDLEIIILSEVSQTEKDKYHMISLTCGIYKNDTNELIYKTERDTQS